MTEEEQRQEVAVWVEYTEPEQRGRLFNLINKKK